MWLGLFDPDAVQMSKHGGKPKKAFNALAIVVSRDHTSIDREDLSFEFGGEIASASINLEDPKIKDIIELLELANDGFYMLAWGDRKPHKKKDFERSYMPIIHNPQSTIGRCVAGGHHIMCCSSS